MTVPLSPPHTHLLHLQPLGPDLCRVLNAHGLCVGHFKRIQGVWKFKAVGQDADGHTVPGGGPLTHRHNTVLAELTDQAANTALL